MFHFKKKLIKNISNFRFDFYYFIELIEIIIIKKNNKWAMKMIETSE